MMSVATPFLTSPFITRFGGASIKRLRRFLVLVASLTNHSFSSGVRWTLGLLVDMAVVNVALSSG